MIERYRDHAANERTFLAWIRTGITVLMFGFLVEKFELFISLLTRQMPIGRIPQTPGPGIQGIQGISVALVVLGLFIIGTATLRYLGTKKEIEDQADFPFRGTRLSLFLAAVLLLFGLYLLLYLTRLV